MATFTIALKNVITIVNASSDNNYEAIGLNSYPIFDPDYRDALNQKIVEHYWNREIGMETIEMFKFAMKRKMNEVMPYYNQLYDTERLNFDPLSTMNITTKASSNVLEDTSANSANVTNNDSKSQSRSVQSSTPQTMLSGNEDYAESAADVNSASEVDSDSTQNSDSTATTQSNADSNVSGYQGIPGNIIMAYRASLLNIDMMVINEIDECFMQIWDTGDEYSSTTYYPYSTYMLGVQ